jgi:putative Holliday junction resolvase
VDRNRLSRILGLDYGERRIGIALSDPLGIIAKPLTVLDRKIAPDYISQLSDIILNKQVTTVVVGLPLTLMGKESKQTEIVLSFVSQLKETLSVPVITIDERLSSVAAEKSLQKQAIKTGHNKGRIDETAAAIFLQEYLDSIV